MAVVVEAAPVAVGKDWAVRGSSKMVEMVDGSGCDDVDRIA